MKTKSLDNVSITVFLLCKDGCTNTINNNQKQFSLRPEFDLHVVPDIINTSACKKRHNIIQEIVSQQQDDIIVICKENVELTEYYDRDTFLSCLINAAKYGTNVIFGNVCDCGNIVPAFGNLYWIDWAKASYFTVIFKTAYKQILSVNNSRQYNNDEIFHGLTNKLAVFPFIAKRSTLGVSVCKNKESVNNENKISQRFMLYQRIVKKYNLIDSII